MTKTKQTAFNPFNHSVYHYPQSHMLNRGGMFSSIYFREWYLWQGILSDERGGSWGVTFSLYQVVEEGTIYFPVSAEILNMQTGEAHSFERRLKGLNGMQEGEHEDFRFQYGEAKKAEVAYQAFNDTWRLVFADKAKGISLHLEVSGTNRYHISSPSGVVSMGEPIEKSYSPVKLLGLAFSYFSNHMGAKGTLALKGEEFPLEGNLCFDHQWGNFQHPNFRHSECNIIKVLFNDYKYARLDLWSLKGREEMHSVWVEGGEVKSYAVDSEKIEVKAGEPVSLEGRSYTTNWEVSCLGRQFLIRPYYEKQLKDSYRKGAESWVGWAEVLDKETQEQVGTAFLEIYGS